MQNNKSILIVGNGPSSSYKEAGKLAKGCEVARTNWFFLEKEQIFGKQVDYLFHAVHALFINYIYFVLNKDNSVYHIVNNIDINPNKSQRVKNILKHQMPKIDIHAPREVSKSCPYPYESTGLVMFKYFLESGYQTIHIAGIDFYQGKYVYLNTKNAKIIKLYSRFMKRNRLGLGLGAYDVRNPHTLEYDINYLNDLLAQYPEVKIIATSCHPKSTKIWQQFKQVEVMELSSHQSPEIYDAYLDKQWLQKAVDDFSKKYGGFKLLKLHRLFVFLRYCKGKIVGINR
jgi:hypothetical protein